ncbi:MAG: flagellar filament capping protein FliD [Steroidobacteraceae bacterium]
MSSTISGAASTAPTTAAPTSAASNAVPATTAAVTSTGIGSGLNISAIVSSLTSAFGAGQQNQITSQANALDAQVSAFGTFTSSLDSLQSTLGALETPGNLAGFSATVADNTIATATAAAGAVAGTYSLEVQNVATAASLTSQPVASSGTPIGTGTLTIAVGTSSTSINIDSTDNTLAGIAAAINSAPNNPGVSASIITATDGARLVLSGTTTGAGNAITVTQSGGDGGLSSLVYDPSNNVTNLTQTQAASDANFTINGYAATSASNVASGAITGVTLNLLKASPEATPAPTPATYTPTTLTISPDTTAAQASISAFVTALNSTLTSIQTLTAYDPTTQTAGALQGNATLQSFQNQLSNILDTVTANGTGGVNSLADLGITANASTGNYDTNTTTLANALSSSLSGVGNLLGGTNGIVTQIDTLVTQYTQAGGLLSTINQGLQTGLTNVATQQTALNAELATYSATLTTQYNAMDAAVAALKETQTYLTAEFNPSSSSSSSSSSSLSSGTTST